MREAFLEWRCAKYGFISRQDAKPQIKPATFEGASGDERFMFTGHQGDGESGLYYAPFRYYSPFQARWTTRDPLGMIDGPNVYAYVRGNPVVFIDPLGLWQITIGGGYGYAGRITVGRNEGRWNLDFGFGYGIGGILYFSPEDVEPGYASSGPSTNIGIEVSGRAKHPLLGGVAGGLRVKSEADICYNLENRAGVFGKIGVPGTNVYGGGYVDAIVRGNLDRGTFEGDIEPGRLPFTVGFGGMAFGGVTGGIAW